MGSTVRIVVVDDHPLLRDGLVARLSAVPGFEVVGEANSAAQALELLERVPADVVLTDLSMDGMDGAQLTRRVVERFDGMAVLVFSMYRDEHDVQRCMAAGARGYVLKDEPAASLVAAIHSALQGATYLSPAVSHMLFRPRVADSKELTDREREVLDLLGRGLSTKQTAKSLGIETRTVQAHRGNIRRKLRLDGQAALIKYAMERARERGG